MGLLRRFKRVVASLGPGFVTGAADDDPSGIATYSIAGAQFGYTLNWMTLFLLPSMIAVQEMCGRIGMVTGKGLAAVLKNRIGMRWAAVAVALLATANIINIGADLAVMADVMSNFIRIPSVVLLFAVAGILAVLEIAVPYRIYVRYLTGLGTLLCVYIFTAFLVPQDWKAIAAATFIPHIQISAEYLMTMVGFLGTTISPYLFFWQSDEEVEDEIINRETRDFGRKLHLRRSAIPTMRRDTITGMAFSNIITFFVILTTAATLHAQGITQIESAQQAAESLRPLAGDRAFLLFSVGIIGIGLQSIPILAGSVGYAVAELFGLTEGLGKPFGKARGFYIIIATATVAGTIMNVLGVNPMAALYWAAVINGIIAVPLILFILKIADDPRVVGVYRTPKLLRIIGWITELAMAAAVIMLLWRIIAG
jgi:NRAMP (natural resistance-associated macrophage protein)-like metal ion transporter